MWHTLPSPFSGAASYGAYGKSRKPYTSAISTTKVVPPLVTLETSLDKAALDLGCTGRALPAGTWSLMDTA